MNPANENDLHELIDEFEELADWDERYEFLIELGRELPSMPAGEQTDSNKVEGCMSTVWMVTDYPAAPSGEPRLNIHADSDSIMVKGLLAILLTAFNGKTRDEVASFDVDGLFQRLGLDQHLSPNRRNGLFSMVKRIRQSAVTP